MVRLHTSLLAVTLATGSVLASSSDYQRRSEFDINDQVQARGEGLDVPHRHFRYGLACAGRCNVLQSRGFEDEEDLFGRDVDAFDDLEAREPSRFRSAGKAFEFGKKIFKDKRTRRFAKGAGRFADGVDIGQQVASNFQSRGFEDAFDDLEAREPSRFKSAEEAFEFGKRIFKGKHIKGFADGVDIGQQVASNFQSRGFEDNEDLFGRDIDAFDDLEAREPLNIGSAAKALKFGERVVKDKRTRNIAKGVNTVANGVAVGQQVVSTFQSRGLEDEEDLFIRDIDTFDDLEAREPFNFGKAFKFGEKVIKDKRTRKFAKGVNRAANGIDAGQQVVSAFQSRGLEDNEDLELFGREYDLVDERDIIDDLD